MRCDGFMKEISKEELKKMLWNLKVEKKLGVQLQPSAVACCYSIALPKKFFRFEEVNEKEYIGKHNCASCGKVFGQSFEEAINDCRQLRYQEYVKKYKNSKEKTYKFAFGNDYYRVEPCLGGAFYKKFKENNVETLDFMSEHGLVFSQDSFNRMLTFDEWCFLIADCEVQYNFLDIPYNECFEYNEDFTPYIHVAKMYQDEGFNAKIEFNCDECQKNGKNPLEFHLILAGEKLISYPDVISSNIKNPLSTFLDYRIALEFLKLKGYASYELINGVLDTYEEISIKDIDYALRTILKVDI